MVDNWKKTACILCSLNCGIEAEISGREMNRIRGDKAHPASRGYLCQKAQRLNYYQNGRDRLSVPLKRMADGNFQAVSWEQAISEIAQQLNEIRNTWGGETLAYFGGGGQGNHLAGPYAKALRTAMGTRNYYSSLAQEKTGGFWVDGRLYGRQNCHVSEDIEHAELVVFIGTNPWQSHGIRNARLVLKDIQRDPNRKMIVIDPRRTETAELADLHLQVRPGTDAYLLAAILSLIVREGEEDGKFLESRTVGFDAVRSALLDIPVEQFAAKCGLELELITRAARMISSAATCAVRTDLGLEHTLNSTLNQYLRALLYLLTGNFGKKGGSNFHTSLVPLMGHSAEGEAQQRSAVTGFPFICNLLPPAILPEEILNDTANRTRAVFVDSSNPLVSMPDSQAYREAFEKLDLLVVVDVAMTETARLAHYVLPAASQFEKYEATFFNMEFPANSFHLRQPLFEAYGECLPEAEIYSRLIGAMGLIDVDLSVLEKAAASDRRAFAFHFQELMKSRPDLMDYAPVILYRTLGKYLPNGAAAAAFLWATSHRFAAQQPAAVKRAGFPGDGAMLGEQLFEAILNSPSGLVFSVNDQEDVWSFLKHRDGRIHLEIPELLDELKRLSGQPVSSSESYPFILVAGERRSYNANTIYRDPAWRREDPDGFLRLHPSDAAELGINDQDLVVCESARGQVTARVSITDTVLEGVVTLPHGYGMDYPEESGELRTTGVNINMLSELGHRDRIAGTPFHKHIPVRISRLEL